MGNIIVPINPDLSVLINSAEKEAKVMTAVTKKIEDLNYEYQGKLRSYNSMAGRKAKAEAELLGANAEISSLTTAIAVLPEGKVKSDMEWNLVLATRAKENAERALLSVDESAILLAYEDLVSIASQHNTLITKSSIIDALF